MKACAFARFSLFTDSLPYAPQFLRHMLVSRSNLVEGIGDLPREADPSPRQTRGKVAIPHALQACQNYVEVRRIRAPGFAVRSWERR